MDALSQHWRRASRGHMHRSPTITEDGIVLGFDTILVRRSDDGFDLAGDEDRLLCLLSITRRRRQSPRVIRALRRALSAWARGDKALAHIHLAFADLPKVETREDAWRLHQGDGLIDLGMAPRVLAKQLGLDLPPAVLSKYDQDEPRNPARSGRVSGQWVKDPVAADSIAFAPSPPSAVPSLADAGGAEALEPTAPSLVDALGAEALDWLSSLAGRLALPAAVFGAVFVPSPNDGTSEKGVVPGRPGMSYALDNDTGTLRLSLDSDPDPDNALVAKLGTDGVYRDVETKVAIARAVGSSAVLIDLDRAPDAVVTTTDDAATDDDEPKLCPDPSKDQGGGRKLFDIMYEQWCARFRQPAKAAAAGSGTCVRAAGGHQIRLGEFRRLP